MAKNKRRSQYGFIEDGKLVSALTVEHSHPQSEESNVERDGYRTLKQQIEELEDAGMMLRQYRAKRYPGATNPTDDVLDDA